MSGIKLTSSDYFEEAYKTLEKELKIKNKFALPKIEKVVINAGIGKFDKSQKDEIVDALEKLTGQVPKKTTSRTSISGFKLRAGDLVGVTTTLRGQKMKDFVLNLVYLSLPRTKDFRGISSESWDKNFSTYSLGIRDASIFPQIGFNSKVNFGLQVNICFKEANQDNKKMLEKLKFPFKK